MAVVSAGDVVADLELPDQTGTPRRLTGLLGGGPVVLFFYPAAMTRGCTRESCHFRDLAAEFAELGAVRAGISAGAAGPVDRLTPAVAGRTRPPAVSRRTANRRRPRPSG